ncbi:hypothetical protein [Salinibacillus xinjiangensis]|uniref:Uncharacterized protein n=1 Tax=Salinibacillus xinjiangensis TaxID=1229268 RepID=A0A6G1X3W5_9BACI|nr:hypothetical protein [Salinibacillus xinjiangensis]MRG85681.1 hypothetical protein [Salinibacillus xinjiangensis]
MTFLFVLFAAIGLGLAILAFVESKTSMFWLAGLFMYIVSFLGAFSIGLYLLVFTAAFWTIALAKSVGWLKRNGQYVVFGSIGILIWFVSITILDDYWLYLPFALLDSFL